MSTGSPPPAYRHVVCGVETEEASAPAITEAARVAAPSGARLSLVHVSGTVAGFTGGATSRARPKDELQAELIVDVHSWLDPVAERHGASAVVIVGDDPSAALKEWVADQGADLIVVCPRRTGISRLLGSFAAGVLNGAPCPVLLAPPPS